MKAFHKLFLPSVLFVLAFALRLYWARGFDGLYGQDAFAYYYFADSLRESLSRFQAPDAFFWPLGYPVLLMTAFAIAGKSALTGQMLNILLGSALAPLLYGLGREMKLGRGGAFLAGLLMALCGQAIQSSIVLMSDIPALFWAVLSAYFLFLYMRKEQAAWLIAASLALALAIITRWLYLALLPVWGSILLYHWHGIRWKPSLVASVAMLLILLPQAIYSRTSPYPVLNHEWLVTWSPSHFWRQDFVNGDGTFYYESANSLFYAAPFYQPYYLSATLLSLSCLGFIRLTYQKNVKDLLFLLGWALIPLLFLMGIPYQNMRFGLILFPVAALLVGIGADWLFLWPCHWRFRFVAYSILGLIIGYSIAQTLIISHYEIRKFVETQQKDAATIAWADRLIPSGSVVYTFGLTLRLKQLEDIRIHDIFNETPESLDAQWVRGQEDYLLVNVWEINHQWEGRSPYIAFHWIYNNRGVWVLGRYGNYVLCRING
jgi:4-amino-4-deoxy-L-arabinose transferase-like glycosyltransferase